MNRIEEKFESLKKENKKALISFITAGDPVIEKTAAFVRSLEESGIDIIELGIPFSDPVAEGPVIEAASGRALAKGIKINDIFEAVAEIRETSQMPILFMMYVNCIYGYGREKFFLNCAKYGVDGVIVPDLPFEEQGEILEEAEKNGVISIFLVAPTSEDRIEKIVKDAKGFIYCVSSKGVTGVRSSFDTDFEEFSEKIRKYSSCPIAVGFGISNPEQAKELSQNFDGIIMGSAFVRLIEAHGEDAVVHLKNLAAKTRKALDGK